MSVTIQNGTTVLVRWQEPDNLGSDGFVSEYVVQWGLLNNSLTPPFHIFVTEGQVAVPGVSARSVRLGNFIPDVVVVLVVGVVVVVIV